MATKQREISVSEFFTKNRHLLGFDNPRKALLTAVKEAVDNSLDACEEAGILPEITIEIRDLGLDAKADGDLTKARAASRHVEDNGPGHRAGAGPEDLRQAALRLEVPPAEAVARPAGHRHQRRGHVRPAHHRQADPRHLAAPARRKPAHDFEIQIDTRKNKPVVTEDEELDDWHQEHGTRVEIEIVANWQAGQRFVDRYLEHTALANPHATVHYIRPRQAPAHLPARHRGAAQGGARRSSRTRTASSWAC